jgi:hypothetical protein
MARGRNRTNITIVRTAVIQEPARISCSSLAIVEPRSVSSPISTNWPPSNGGITLRTLVDEKGHGAAAVAIVQAEGLPVCALSATHVDIIVNRRVV